MGFLIADQISKPLRSFISKWISVHPNSSNLVTFLYRIFQEIRFLESPEYDMMPPWLDSTYAAHSKTIGPRTATTTGQ
jgi:hypothetical protein